MQKHVHDPKPKAKAKSDAKPQAKPAPDSRSRAVTQNFDRDDALQRASEPAHEDESGAEDTASAGAMEGEGSYTAGRRYDESVRHFVGSGKVEASAREAQRAVDSPERKALAEAERIGKRGGRGHEPTRR